MDFYIGEFDRLYLLGLLSARYRDAFRDWYFATNERDKETYQQEMRRIEQLRRDFQEAT